MNGNLGVGDVIAFVVNDLALVVGLIVVARAQTSEPWRWRSGTRKP